MRFPLKKAALGETPGSQSHRAKGTGESPRPGRLGCQRSGLGAFSTEPPSQGWSTHEQGLRAHIGVGHLRSLGPRRNSSRGIGIWLACPPLRATRTVNRVSFFNSTQGQGMDGSGLALFPPPRSMLWMRGMQDPQLRITEIFHSIQGESSQAGERFSFVRLTGCPLRCTYCDTTYSYSGGRWMTVVDIVDEVASHDTRWVLVTGGEPLAQSRALDLVLALRSAGKSVSIETGGEEDVAPYAGLAKLVMDIKTPSSGEKAERCFRNLAHLLPGDEIKFVLCDRADYEWAKEVCAKYALPTRFTVLFSPSFGQLELKTLAEWILNDRLNVRLQTQLHKHIWGSETKGV